MSEMIGHDLYVKVTNSKGESHIHQHRAWDSKKLFASITAQHQDPKKPKSEHCKVELSSEQDYRKVRGR